MVNYDHINVYVDETAEGAVVELLSNVFGQIAYMDADTVRRNIELACEGGFKPDDRSISADTADWLMDSFSLIFAGLIVNSDFRGALMEAVSVEIALDNRTDDFIRKTRLEMQSYETGEVKKDGEKNEYVIDLGRYNDDIYRSINKRLSDSFGLLDSYENAIDHFVRELVKEDKLDIGFCVCNWMYLLRAFSQNHLFTDYVKLLLDSVRWELSI
ncbi:MAG: hypothetical protein K6F87_08080 [Lachnospiraceae bacterium]|nr:hypothetical protein [Lachnospiraceae bacterium]